MSTADVRFDIARPDSPKGDLGDAPVRAPRDEREPFAKTLERSRRARPEEDDRIDRDAPVKQRREAKGGDEKVEARDEPARDAAPARKAPRRAQRSAAPAKDLDTLVDEARCADAVTGPRAEAPERGGGGRQRPRGLGPLDACLSFAPEVAVPVAPRAPIADLELSLGANAGTPTPAKALPAALIAAELGAPAATPIAPRAAAEEMVSPFPEVARALGADGEALFGRAPGEAANAAASPAVIGRAAGPRVPAREEPQRAELLDRARADSAAPPAVAAKPTDARPRDPAASAPAPAPTAVPADAARSPKPPIAEDPRARAAVMEQPPLVSAPPLGAGPAIDPRFAEVIVEEGAPEDPGAASATPALHAPSDVRREGVIAAARAPTAIDAEPNADAIDRHAVAVAVSRLTRERSAHAEVEIPEIGRIAVTAQRNAREIDVSVLAPAASVGILRDAQGELDASLRSAHVPLGSLHVGVGDHGARDGQRPSEGAPWQGDGSRASGDHAAIAGRSAASRRVRFVL